VIDNCEHVIADAVAVVEKILRQCPLLTILATSREALAHSAELVYRLPPMDSQTASALFLARVHQADALWSTDAQGLAAVADICKILDGIPLAIELAASRVASLGLVALRSRLNGGITLTGSRDLPVRHQSMTAMIAWSYDLLSDGEAQLFRRLSVLAGGFTLELGESVGASQSLPTDRIADTLSRLVQKSLLNVTHMGTSTRFGFLESIRTFALKRLTEAGELEDTMLRLIGWLKRRATAQEFSDVPAATVEGHVDLDNAVVAIRWAEANARYAEIVDAAVIMIGFARAWYGHRRHIEARAVGLSLLQRLDDRESPEIVGRLSHRLIGTVTGAELIAMAPRAIELLQKTGHPGRAADFHARCAEIEWGQGNAAAAEDHLSRAAALVDTPELRRSISGLVTLEMIAYVRCMLGDFPGARACLEQIEPPAGNHEIVKQIVLAEVEFYEGNIEKAIEIAKKSASDVNSHRHAHHERLNVYGNLGKYLFSIGDTRGAEEALRESAGILVSLSSPNYLYFAVSYARYIAALVAHRGKADLAARLLGACDATEQRSGDASVQDTHARDIVVRAIAEQSSPEQVKALLAQGAGEDVFALLEEFLAQPAASESARLSATSSP
jgi:predicted ATPase